MSKVRILVLALGALLVCQSLQAQIPFKKKKETPAESACFGGREVNDEEAYLAIRDFADGLYASNEEGFRDEVDRLYLEKLQSDSEEAYEINLSARSQIKFVLEDRFRIFEGLYDNLMIQDLVNVIGQGVVPAGTDKYYAYRLIADPIPFARTLSTGTIYISTGLAAMLDNEAQLSYILAHEAAHVDREHHKRKLLMQLGEEEFFSRCDENQEMRRRRFALWSGIAMAGVAAATGSRGGYAAGNTFRYDRVGGIAAGMALGARIGAAAAMLTQEHTRFDLEWNRYQEEEADKIAFESLLNAKLNVRTAPELYLALEDQAVRDRRFELGFIGDRKQVRARYENIKQMLESPEYAEVLGQPLGGDGPEFRLLMAELKRDNGVLAYHKDMLQVARKNLAEAAEVRDTDPTALYYYGKVLKLVGRSDDERELAIEMFSKSTVADKRNSNYGSYLHRAIALMDPDANDTQKSQAAEMLKEYVAHYVAAQAEAGRIHQDYPLHLETIYDYMSRLGEFEWKPAGLAVPLNYVDVKADKALDAEPAPAATVTPVAAEAPPAPAAKGKKK